LFKLINLDKFNGGKGVFTVDGLRQPRLCVRRRQTDQRLEGSSRHGLGSGQVRVLKVVRPELRIFFANQLASLLS